MIEQFGLSVVHAYMQHGQDNAEETVRNLIATLTDSHYTHQLDSGAAINVGIQVNSKNRSAIIDFTDTSPQQNGNYNAPKSICRAAVLYVLRTLVDKNIPMNEGCLKPIQLVIPKGSMIHPKYPAAVITGNTEVGFTYPVFRVE